MKRLLAYRLRLPKLLISSARSLLLPAPVLAGKPDRLLPARRSSRISFSVGIVLAPVLSMVSSPPLDKVRHHGFGPCLHLSQISPLDPITIQTIAARAVLDIDPQAVFVGADRDHEGARVVVIGVAAGVRDLSRPDRTFDPFQGAGHALRRWRSRTAAAP